MSVIGHESADKGAIRILIRLDAGTLNVLCVADLNNSSAGFSACVDPTLRCSTPRSIPTCSGARPEADTPGSDFPHDIKFRGTMNVSKQRHLFVQHERKVRVPLASVRQGNLGKQRHP